MTETITLNTLGPHSPKYTAEVAWGLAECVRVLNYATGSSAAAGIAYPVTVYELLGALSTTTGRMPQLLSQLARWLEDRMRAGALADDRDGDVGAAVADARGALDRARSSVADATAALQDAQNAIGGLRSALDSAEGGAQ